jgi:protein SCO1/2
MTKKEKQKANSLNLSIILVGFLFIFSSCEEKPKKLPYIGNFDLEYKQVDGKTIVDTIYPIIPEFSYFNEDSVLVNKNDFKDKVWVAEFFFATCPTICSTRKLQNIQKKYNFYLSLSIQAMINLLF